MRKSGERADKVNNKNKNKNKKKKKTINQPPTNQPHKQQSMMKILNNTSSKSFSKKKRINE